MKAKVQWIAISLIMLVGVLAMESLASAAVYQWELSDPSDPTSARQKSATLCPDGADVTAEPGVSFFGLDLSKAYLINADLSKSDLSECVLINADLSGANLQGGYLHHPDLTNATLISSNLKHIYSFDACFKNTNLSGANFNASKLYEADFTQANLSSADLSQTDLCNAYFVGANLSGTHLDKANFTWSNLENANFSDASIEGATFETSTFSSAQLMSTSSYKNKNLQGVELPYTDLRGCNFAGFNLSKVWFNGDLTGVVFSGAWITEASFGGGLSSEQLYSTLDYQKKDLQGIGLFGENMTGWDLSGFDLKNSNFQYCNFKNVNFDGSDITGDSFYHVNLSPEQLYSTSNYKAANLTGHIFWEMNMKAWEFTGQQIQDSIFESVQLTKADFSNAKLTNDIFFDLNMMKANFSSALLSNTALISVDARGAKGLNLSGVKTINVIQPDGSISGLNLLSSEYVVSRTCRQYTGTILTLHNYLCEDEERGPIAVRVQNGMVVEDGSILDLVFDENTWNSTISFDAGIDVTLGGILKLEFEDGTDISSLVGTAYHIFDWTGVGPKGKFTVESDYAWNLDALYSTGEIILVPEPSGFVMGVMGLMGLFTIRRKITNRLVSK